MADGTLSQSAADAVILKILTGVQSGAEVSLAAGEYALGNGPDDDIQIVDVSLLPGHLRLRVAPGRIELGGGAGAASTAAGVALVPGDAWREIEPLDVVSAGTTRFALGHPSSRWASIAEMGAEAPARVPEAETTEAGPAAWLARARSHRLAAPLAGLAALLLVALWFALGSVSERGAGAAGTREAELASVRAALDRFPFGRGIEARQDVDGTLYVTGYVETPVERRALVGALDALGVPARVRLWVLQTLRGEITALIEAQRLPVTAEVVASGVAVLDGTILDRFRAERFVELVRDRVLGLAGVESRIRTVETLLADVERLASAAQIQPWILLRADGEVIEATGAIPLHKVDAWVGFLQGYARRFSKEVALRSFVQLQAPGSSIPPQAGRAIVLGASDGGTPLNVDRLNAGALQIGDVLAGASPARVADARRAETQAPEGRQPEPARPNPARTDQARADQARADASGVETRTGASIAAGPASAEPTARSTSKEPAASAPNSSEAGDGGTAGSPQKDRADGSPDTGRGTLDGSRPVAGDAFATAQTPGPAGAATKPSAPNPAAQGSIVQGSEVAGSASQPSAQAQVPPALPAPETATAERAAGEDLARQGRDVLQRWQSGRLNGDPRERALRAALERLLVGVNVRPLEEREPPPWYVPILSESRSDPRPTCWAGTQLRPDDIAVVLFWLDLLSASESLTLATFGRDVQVLLLETALNPTRVAACAEGVAAAREAARNSLYLREVERNGGFARFIVRDLPPFSLDITGVNLAQRRFVITRAGARLFEGSAPDRSSRLALIGELGVAIQLGRGLSAVIYEPDLAWRVGQ